MVGQFAVAKRALELRVRFEAGGRTDFGIDPGQRLSHFAVKIGPGQVGGAALAQMEGGQYLSPRLGGVDGFDQAHRAAAGQGGATPIQRLGGIAEGGELVEGGKGNADVLGGIAGQSGKRNRLAIGQCQHHLGAVPLDQRLQHLAQSLAPIGR